MMRAAFIYLFHISATLFFAFVLQVTL